MAEGFLRAKSGGKLDAASAGVRASGYVHPLAIRAMREIGIDISGQKSKSLDVFGDEPFDFVVTVCDNARETCPVFPAKTAQLHWSLPDPAEAQGSDDEKMSVFRSVRDEIERRVTEFLQQNVATEPKI
jgi:arsenate reductase